MPDKNDFVDNLIEQVDSKLSARVVELEEEVELLKDASNQLSLILSDICFQFDAEDSALELTIETAKHILKGEPDD